MIKFLKNVGFVFLLSVIFVGLVACNDAEKFSVTFLDYNDDVITTVSVESGKAATAPEDPTREGYTFSGWDKDFDKISSSLAVKATYTPNQYQITFNTDGGSQVTAVSATFDTDVTELPTPTKDGFNFAGWLYNGELVTLPVKYEYTNNIELIASWTDNTAVYNDFITFVNNVDAWYEAANQYKLTEEAEMTMVMMGVTVTTTTTTVTTVDEIDFYYEEVTTADMGFGEESYSYILEVVNGLVYEYFDEAGECLGTYTEQEAYVNSYLTEIDLEINEGFIDKMTYVLLGENHYQVDVDLGSLTEEELAEIEFLDEDDIISADDLSEVELSMEIKYNPTNKTILLSVSMQNLTMNFEGMEMEADVDMSILFDSYNNITKRDMSAIRDTLVNVN